MMTNSKQKGSRGEREAAKLLLSLGLATEARRSRQYQGVVTEQNSADIIHNIEGIRFEIKFGYDGEEIYKKEVQGWVAKAIEETPDNDNWVILWRKTRRKWLAIFDWNGVVCSSYDISGVINRLRKN